MVLPGNLCHCKISSKFVLPCLWAPVQKSMKCGVFYKLLQQHRKAGGWTQCERKINATIYLEQFATHWESSNTKGVTTSGYPSSSTAIDWLDFHKKSAKQLPCQGEKCALYTHSAAPITPRSVSMWIYKPHKLKFFYQVFIELSAYGVTPKQFPICRSLFKAQSGWTTGSLLNQDSKDRDPQGYQGSGIRGDFFGCPCSPAPRPDAANLPISHWSFVDLGFSVSNHVAAWR